MLQELRIQNLAVIESLHTRWNPGFNVITGETGAGKSIFINALKCILGAKINNTLIRKGKEKLRIEAIFDMSNNKPLETLLKKLEIDSDGQELIIERTLIAGGRNRCRVNGTLIPMIQLEKLGRFLIDLHGQHSQQTLLNPNTHIRYIDGYGGHESKREAFEQSHRAWREQIGALESLEQQANAVQEKKDFFSFQYEELEKACLFAGEDKKLEEQLEISNNFEKITQALYNAQELIEQEPLGALTIIHQLRGHFDILRNNTSAFNNAPEVLDSFQAGLETLQSALQHFELPEAQNAESLDELNGRLAFLQRLQSKYQTDIDGLISLRDERKRALDKLTDFGSERAQLRSKIESLYHEMMKRAAALTKARKKIAGQFTKAVQDMLAKLGMEQSALSCHWITHQSHPFQPESIPATGAESLNFHFVPGPEEDPRPLQSIASGGEASRIMLSIKSVLAGADVVPVLVFDEIDTGVGGETANRIGEVMQELGQSHQILTITHLHQVAALAGHHAKVHKSLEGGRFTTSVYSLSQTERVKELARMMGNAESASSVKHAQNLLEKTQK